MEKYMHEPLSKYIVSVDSVWWTTKSVHIAGSWSKHTDGT